MIGVNVWWVYLAPQNIPRAIGILTHGNKVVLYTAPELCCHVVCVPRLYTSPWHNRHGWLGVKNQTNQASQYQAVVPTVFEPFVFLSLKQLVYITWEQASCPGKHRWQFPVSYTPPCSRWPCTWPSNAHRPLTHFSKNQRPRGVNQHCKDVTPT